MGNRSIVSSYPKTPIAGSMHPVSCSRVEPKLSLYCSILGKSLPFRRAAYSSPYQSTTGSVWFLYLVSDSCFCFHPIARRCFCVRICFRFRYRRLRRRLVLCLYVDPKIQSIEKCNLCELFSEIKNYRIGSHHLHAMRPSLKAFLSSKASLSSMEGD